MLVIPAEKMHPVKSGAYLQICKGEDCRRMIPFESPFCKWCTPWEQIPAERGPFSYARGIDDET